METLVSIWRFLNFSMKTCTICAQSYPLIAGVLLFLFLLVEFFNLLVLLFPFLVGVALLVRIFWTSGGLMILEANQKSDLTNPCDKSVDSAPAAGDRDEGKCLLKQKSRRTHVRKIKWDAKSAEERLDISSLAISNDLVSKTMLLAKEARALKSRHKGRAISSHGETSGTKRSYDAHSILDSDRDILSTSSSDDESENVEGVGGRNTEAQQDGTKAVQWNDDDQRNLLDLGLSEIERNKRLERLIARRRARKLFKMQIEKGLIDLDTILPNQIAPVYIARNNPYIAEMDGIETPGSAPSIMFPGKNLFDLPYDPLEEKPDLTTDSFQQEFTAASQKDMQYCRHQSFCYGAANRLGLRSRALDGSRLKRKTSLGPHDRQIENMLSNQGGHDVLVDTLSSKVEAKNISHIDSISEIDDSEGTIPYQATTSGVSKDRKCKQIHSGTDTEGKMRHDQNAVVMSSRSDSHLDQHVTDLEDSNDETSTSSEEDDRQYPIPATKSGVSQHEASKWGRVPPKPMTCAIPLPIEKGKMEDRLYYSERGPCHTPTHSIASDMQVEVSDIGSPALTVDGGNSPTDRESLYSDGDIDTWAASSSHSSRTEETDSKFRDMRGFNEDLANMGSSGNSENTKDVAEFSMPLQQLEEPDNTYSLSSTVLDTQAYSTTPSMSLDNVRLVEEQVMVQRTSGLSDAPSLVNQAEILTPPENLVSQTRELSPDPLDDTTTVDVAAANKIDNLKDEKHIKDKDGEVKSGLSQPSEGTIGALSSKEEEPIKENENVNNATRDLERVTSNDMINTIDAIKSSDPNQDGKAEEITSENDVSEERQTSKDPGTAPVQPNLTTQEENNKLTEKSTNKPDTKMNMQAQDVAQNGTETAAELTTPAEEVGVSQTEAVAPLDIEKSSDALTETEITRSVEGTAKIPQNSVGDPSELKIAAEESETLEANITDVKNKTTEDSPELKNQDDEVGSSIRNSNKTALSETATWNDTKEVENFAADIGSVLNNATGESTELTKDIGSVYQKESDNTPKLKSQAEENGRISQKEAETVEEFKRNVEETRNVLDKAFEVDADLKAPAEKIENVPAKENEDTIMLERPAKETGNVSQITEEVAVILERPAEETGNVLRNTVEVATETKGTSDKSETSAQKADEAPKELNQSSKEISNASQVNDEAPTGFTKLVEEIKT